MRSPPDTALARDAERLVRSVEPAPLFEHTLRTFHLARAFADKRALPLDEEDLYIAALFHDVGLYAPHKSGARAFMFDSSRALREFLGGRADAERADAMARAIELHMLPFPRASAGPVAQALQVGAWMDAVGWRRWELAPVAREIERDHPRAGFFGEFAVGVARTCTSVRGCLGLLVPSWG